MKAPAEIMNVYKKFDEIGLETLSKAWYKSRRTQRFQRTVDEIEVDYKKFGTTGNCFDLALWLYDAFQKAELEAYFIGEHVGTPDAHVAVLVRDYEGYRYYCDLGDQWIQPILVDASSPHFTSEAQDGFFPGARVVVDAKENEFEIIYLRSNDKQSRQSFITEPIPFQAFMEAGEHSQQLLRHPLVEKRVYDKKLQEVVLWEFSDFKSFTSTTKGLKEDEPVEHEEDWAERISSKTGIDKDVVIQALRKYKQI